MSSSSTFPPGMRAVAFALAVALCASSSSPALGADPAPEALAAPPQPLSAVADAGGVTLSWRGAPATTSDGKPSVADSAVWPLTKNGGAWLPIRYVSLEADPGAKVNPAVLVVESSPYWGAVAPVDAITPRDPLSGLEYPELARPPAPATPSSPVFISHEALARGRRIVVVGISPIFEEGGKLKLASRIEARIAGARTLDARAASAFSTDAGIALPAAKASITAADATVSYAINPLANQTSLRITVATPGLQRIPGSALTAIGLTPSAVNAARVRLFYLGAEVPLLWRDISSPIGQLDAGDEFVFYAPSVGDRYNQTSIYWLAVDAAVDGARMGVRNAQVITPSLTSASYVLERGTWNNPREYQSTLPGLDGDHWFNKLLTSGFVSSDPTLTVSTTVRMPSAAGASTVTLTVYARTKSTHTITATVGASDVPSVWSGDGDSRRSFALPESGGSVTFTLAPVVADSIWADTVSWERPVQLNVGSASGGDFYTLSGADQLYELSGYANWPVIDVTDPQAPLLAQTSAGTLQEGPQQRHYIVAGPSFIYSPTYSANVPVDLASPRSADAVYIAPTSLNSALGPLLTLRQSQGYQVLAIDVDAIYATFGFGMVAPAAIRNFLRHAVGTWTRKPIAATLVGDGTLDPFNYLAKTYSFANYIPPYLLMVDPFSGETACETCYAQLDGDDPLSDAMPDIWIGRLTANSATELSRLVTKITTYESSSAVNTWNRTLGWLADNYQDVNGVTDGAGDFAAYQDQLANFAWQTPPGIAASGTTKKCVYYNPYTPVQGTNPCFQQGGQNARAQAINLINQGAAIVTYNGHGNYQQMAGTDSALAYPNYALINYFDAPYDGGTTDVYGNSPVMTNATMLPVMIQFTCLTSGFQMPGQLYPHTIDERMVLAPNGGALAVWGSSGQGVSHGHDFLARGFFNQLWGSAPGTARLGALTQAGYLSLLENAYLCCGDSIRTFLLLGDPLTKPRVSYVWASPYRALLPKAQR